MDDQQPAEGTTSRRAMIAGLGVAAVSAAVPGCSTYGEKSADEVPVSTPPAGAALAKTSEIPVGGGKIFRDAKVVVTQPTQGTFKAFTAVCTHQQCLVTNVDAGTINCDCHGSKFKAADGAVAGGPAGAPLAPQQVTVTGDSIRLGDA